MTYFHASGSSLLLLVFGFPLFIHVFTVLMHREEIYVQKKKNIRISDLYSDGNEDMVPTFQIFRNRGHNFSDTHARYIVHQVTLNATTVISGDQFHGPHALVVRGGSDISPESQETSIRSRL